jgi:uncharacterized protein (DUF924 family)
MSREEEVLQYWFGNYSDETELSPDSPRVRRWFQEGKSIDKEVKRLFEPDVVKAREGLLKIWEHTPRGRMALVLLLDQFPRHIYRDTSKSYVADEYALELALRSIGDGTDLKLKLIERAFLYLPMMHSEDLKIQNQSIQQYRQLAETAKSQIPLNQDYYFGTLEYALKHHSVIQRFGRFPHRNAILGRKSSLDEQAYLEGPLEF